MSGHRLSFRSAPYGFGRCEQCGALLTVLTMDETPCRLNKENTVMTLTEAYALLKERWPRQSFSISLEAWHHDHDGLGRGTMDIEWAIWNQEEGKHHYGTTLDRAMEQALGRKPDLAAAERTIKHFPDGSGYLVVGPLSQQGKS